MNRIELDSPLDYLLWREGAAGTVELYDIKVQTQRGAGRGCKLVEEMVEQVRGQYQLIYVITRASNYPAQWFYMKTGFRQVGTLTKFYPDTGEDAMMYGLDLKERT